MINHFLLDLRFSIRSLAKHPGFTAVAVLTLALGIGGNVAIFSVVNGLIMRPLPYQDQDRLIYLQEVSLHSGQRGLAVSVADYLDWRDRNQVFDGVALFDGANFTLTGGTEPERVRGAYTSSELLTVLGVEPLIGRDLRPEDNEPGAEGVALVSHGLWQRRYGGDPTPTGSAVTINGRPHTVVGILPPNINFPAFADLWVPQILDPATADRSNRHFNAVARLKPGVTPARARSNMETIAAQLRQEHPAANADVDVSLTPLHEQLLDQADVVFLVLMGAVGFVLLIACANVAALMLGRGVTRGREMAIRTALGASSGRIVRLLLAESLLLAAFSGILGMVLGVWCRDLLIAATPVPIPLWMNFDFDTTVIGFVTLISLFTGILFGLVPALRISRPDLNKMLKDTGARGMSSSGGSARSFLAVAEVAMALVLLIGAGLMIKAFTRLIDVEPGIQTENVLTMRLELLKAAYPGNQEQQVFFEEIRRRIEGLPGVVHASAVSNLPLGGNDWGRWYTVEGEPEPAAGMSPVANNRVITPGYLKTLGIQIRRGRAFHNRDGQQDSPQVVIINDALAQRHWPNQDPIGQRIKYGDFDSSHSWMTIVGVVNDVRHYGLAQQIRPGIYVPLRLYAMNSMTLAIKTGSDPVGLIDSMRRQVWRVDPDLPVFAIQTMEEVLETSLWQTRLTSWILGTFALVALILAVVGVYGVISYGVAQRTREIGIRIALGAGRGEVGRFVIGQGMLLALAGVALGLAGSAGLTRFLALALYNVSPTDPQTFVLVTILFLAAALLACYIPARRATRVDPLVALRHE
jgi:putative ABC transport system permease protein